VLTYGFWREFASDPNIVGRAITLNGNSHTVVGVLSQDFRLNHEVIPTIAGIDKPDFFMPPLDEAKDPNNYGSENYNILARLQQSGKGRVRVKNLSGSRMISVRRPGNRIATNRCHIPLCQPIHEENGGNS
jgi:hypothetical protein